MNKFTTVHSSGAIANRTSKNRTYTHAVWLTRSPEMVRAEAERNIGMQRAELVRLTHELEHGGSSVTRHGVDKIKEFVEHYRASIAKNEARIANPTPESWCYGWSGSKLLAERKATPMARCGFGTEITEAILHNA